MDLQKKLIELSTYKAGCKFVDDFFLINITYKEGWSVIEPTNELIEHGEREGVYYYAAPMAQVSVDEVFENIGTTIAHNLDIEAKCALLEEKVEELQNIFVEEDIDTLKTIKFTFTKKEKKKKSVVKKAKTTSSKKRVVKNVPKKEAHSEKEGADETLVENNEPINQFSDFQSDTFDHEDEEVAIPVTPNGENKYLEIVER